MNFKNFVVKYSIPNKLVIFRFIMMFLVVTSLLLIPLLPEFVFSNGLKDNTTSYFNIIAFSLFVFASLTDWLDGYLARKYDVVSDFGKVFDPLADKVLVNSVLIIFSCLSYIPIWAAVIYIVRDILVDGSRIKAASDGTIVSAKIFGKLKTFFQMFGISLLFIYHPEPTIYNNFLIFNYNNINHLFVIPIYIGLIFSIISGYIYIKEIFSK